MTQHKQNDWFALVSLNDNIDIQQLADLGYTVNNSKLEDKDTYRGYKRVQELFQKEDGQFDEERFNQAYDFALETYTNEDYKNVVGNIANLYEYDILDPFAPPGAKRRDISVTIVPIANPTRAGRGITSMEYLSNPTMTPEEVGQANKVFNWETQEFEDWTPNDKGGLKAFTRPDLVLAQYDEDTLVNGVLYKKGEYKLNDEGDFYYETLGNRSGQGKQFLHIEDTLTTDGSAWNKYDFMDSDGLRKSAIGTIMKTVVKLGPTFIPIVGQIYGGIQALLALNTLVPTVLRAIDGTITNDTENSKFAQSMSAWKNWFERFGSSTSKEGQAGFFTFENINNIVASAGGQLMQQKVVGQIPLYLKALTKGKVTESTLKLGRGLAKTYMVGTSAMETFDAFKEAGASDRMASLGMFASMLSMYGLMSSDYLKYEDLLFGGSRLDTSNFRNTIKGLGETLKWKEEVVGQAGAKKWIIDATRKLTDAFAKMDSKSLLKSALTEGVEETLEEMSFDAVKGTFYGLHALGVIDSDKNIDFGLSAESMLNRYLTSFAGGSIGGAVFGLHNKLTGAEIADIPEMYRGDHFKEIVYYARNGQLNSVRTELKKLHDSGQLGSTNLSNDVAPNVDGKLVLQPAKQGKSQNDVIYQAISAYLDRIEEIVQKEDLQLSDDEIQRLTQDATAFGLDPQTYIDFATQTQRNNIIAEVNQVMQNGIISTAFDDVQSLSEQIVQKNIEISSLFQPQPGEETTTAAFNDKKEVVVQSSQYKKLKAELEDLRTKRNDILNGKRNEYYASQLIFAATPSVRNAFLQDFGVRQYVKTFHNKNYDELPQDAQTQLLEEYNRYANGTAKQKLIEAHNAFSALNADFKNLEALKRNVANPTQLTGDTLGALGAYLTTYQEQLTNANEDAQKEIQSKIEQITRINEIIQEYPILHFAPIISQNGQLDLDQVETMLNNWKKDPVKVYHELVQQYPELQNDIQNPYLLATLRRATYNGTLRSEFTPELQLIFAKVEDAIKNGNIDEIKTTFNQLRDELDENGYSEDEIKNLIKIGNVTLEDFVESIPNPTISHNALELFKQFLNQVKYENTELFDILSEELNVLNPESISTYLIKDPRRIQQLQQLKEWITILDSLLIASSGKNHNFRVNTLFNTSKLLTLDDNTAHTFRRELLVLKQKIDLLLGVSENNQAQKLQQHRLIGVNMRHKFLSLLFQKEGALNFGNRILTELGINQDELLAGYSLPEFKEENYAEIDRVAAELESKIFELVKNSGKEPQTIANILVDCFVNENDNSALHCDTTQFRATQDNITVYDQLMYFTTILGGDSMEFLPQWKAIIENPEFDKAPVFSHEYALRMGYSFVSNPDLFNGVINSLKQKGDQTNDIYLAAKSALNNLFTILGGAGTGKTTLAKVLTEFFPNAEIKYTAATDKQITNLSGILDECEPLGSKPNLISSILGGKEKQYEPVLNEGNIETFKWVKDQNSTYQPFNPESTKILILDEISLWDKIDLEILTDWASKNGVLIFGLGDKFQNQSLLKYNNTNYPTGMEDGYGVFTPDLTVPFRPENIAQQENYDMLYSILRQVLETNLGKPKELLQLDNALDKILQTQVPVFKYFENNGVFAGGTQIVPSGNDIAPEVKKLIEQCRQENKVIRIIVDANTKDKYASYSDILTLSDDVQGDEYDYVVIDKGFGSKKYERVKDVYTLTQRSRRGTIVISSNLSDFKSEMSPRSAGTTSLSDKQIQDFKNWRLSAISVNSKKSIPNITLPENTKPVQYNSDYKTNDQTTYGSNPQIGGQVIDIQDQQPSSPSTPTATNYISWAADTYQLYEQMNSQDRSDKYSVEVLKGVRDWIVYGHSIITKGDLRGKPREIMHFFTTDGKLKPFSYIWQSVGSNTALCAQFNIDGKITNVPLVLLQGDLTNQSITAIKFTPAGLQIGKLKNWRAGVDLTDTTQSIHYRLSQPRLLAPNKELTRESQNKFLVGNTPETNNVGRTFTAASGDSWTTPNEFGEFFSTSNEQWVVAQESNMRLIGVNTELTAEEVISFEHQINGNSAIKFVFAIYQTIGDNRLKTEILNRLNNYLKKGKHTVEIGKKYYTSLSEQDLVNIKPSSIQLINNTESGLYVEGYGTDLLKQVINDPNVKKFITNNWQSLLETLGWKYFYEQTWKGQGEGNEYWHSVENKNKSLILPRIGAIFGDNFIVSVTSNPEVKSPVNETKGLTTDPISEIPRSSTQPSANPIETLSEDQIEDISKPSGESSDEVWFDEPLTSSETVSEDGWSFSEQPIASQKEIVEKQIAEVVNMEGREFKYLFDNDSWTYNIISVSLQGETQAVFVNINNTLQSINLNEETAWTEVLEQLSNDYDKLSDDEKAIIITSLQTLLDNDLTEEQIDILQPVLDLHEDLWEKIGELLQNKMNNGEC